MCVLRFELQLITAACESDKLCEETGFSKEVLSEYKRFSKKVPGFRVDKVNSD